MQSHLIPAKMLTVASAARYAHCSERTIRAWVADGHLTRHENKSGHTRVDGAELAVWLEQRQRTARPPREPMRVDPYVPAIQVRRSERERWNNACRELGMSQRAAFLDALAGLERRAELASADR